MSLGGRNCCEERSILNIFLSNACLFNYFFKNIKNHFTYVCLYLYPKCKQHFPLDALKACFIYFLFAKNLKLIN